MVYARYARSLEDFALHNRCKKRGVVDNIRVAKETFVTKPKEIAHLLKNRFGSADNIHRQLEVDDDNESPFRTQGGGTLPASYRNITPENVQLSSFKYGSDEEMSSATSESSPGGTHISPAIQSVGYPSSNIPSAHSPSLIATPSPSPTPLVSEADLALIHERLKESSENNTKLVREFEKRKELMDKQIEELKYSLFEQKHRSEHLEEQVCDLTELHQHEVTNIKQELSSMEEKMEYQLEERTRDMQEMLESCLTRIQKMEMQQQQQQLISSELLDKSRFRELFSKSLNVVLSILAVLFLIISMIHNLLSPFLTTRLRVISTVTLVVVIFLSMQNWLNIKLLFTTFLDLFPR